MPHRFVQLEAVAAIAVAMCTVTGIAIEQSSEEATVDRIAAAAAAAAPDDGNGTAAKMPVGSEPNKKDNRREKYLTNTDYVVPTASSMRRAPVSEEEISVYVAIGVLTLIAVSLIIAGSVFCYKYSAALRASDRADPGGRQPIIMRTGCPSGDDKLARHAQKSYYQRQKQNIATAFQDRSSLTKSPIQEADSDQEDQGVYEFPGPASTSGLEVNNPMFQGSVSDEE